VNGMENLQPDPPLSEAQLDLVARLTHEQLEAIDSALVKHCAHSWRKLSLVVGSALQQLQLAGIADVFFAQRVRQHIARGKLEGRGDLARMHYAEVRVSAGSGANVT
jgi:Protein of unknown function